MVDHCKVRQPGYTTVFSFLFFTTTNAPQLPGSGCRAAAARRLAASRAAAAIHGPVGNASALFGGAVLAAHGEAAARQRERERQRLLRVGTSQGAPYYS